MSKYFSVDEMKQFVISALPSDAKLIDFTYNSKCFGNMTAKIKQSGKVHTFITDRGEIYYNGEMVCDSSYRYKEKEDIFPRLIQMIKNTLA
ncbi:MAG: hypothetical protein J6K03_05285 [Oscillospiraceae bacterium]|nr:hypothetical protein [Oscillospiraceae bacterium]